MNKKLLNLCICFSVLLFACAGYQRVAKEFVEKKDLPAILYISDPNVLVEFFRSDELRDSLNYFKPEKISYILDDTLIADIQSGYDRIMIETLKDKGFRVYETDSIAQFFINKELMWQLSPVQMSFEEHRVWMSDELPFTDYSLYFDTIVSEYQFNVWMELNPVNADSTVPSHLFFASSSVSDRINGRFVYEWLKRQYSYSYNFTEIDAYDFYVLTSGAAHSHAGYLFDYFLNRYIHFNYSQPHKLKNYYTYDWNRKKIIPAKEKRFVFLKTSQ